MKANCFHQITKTVILLIFTFLISMAVFAQQNPLVKDVHKEDHKEVSFPKAEQFSNTQLNYMIIPARGNTFGYNIYANNKLKIHQVSIPAMPGKNGFKKYASAEKVA